MDLLEPGSWTRPHGLRPSNTRARPNQRAGSGEAAHFLISAEEDPRKESRRVTVGLVALGLFGVVLLNLGIYQSAERQLVERRWTQLGRAADAKRDHIRVLVGTLERQARFVAGQSALASLAHATDLDATTVAQRDEVGRVLDQAARTLNLHHLVVLMPDGRTLVAAGIPVDRDAYASRVGPGVGAAVWRDIHTELDGVQTLEIGVPLDGRIATGKTPRLIVGASVEESLLPLLRRWPYFGGRTHSYLVRAEGSRVVYLTTPDPREARPPAPAEMATPRNVSAAMAATGVESNVEHHDGVRTLRATTRHLPELGWGLVAWMDRDDLVAELRGTMILLALVDLMILVAAAFAAWIWRRSYARGLAHQEMVVTGRHAERVQAIFDTAFDAILTFDRSGRIRTANRAAERIFGRSVTELDGQPLHRFLQWETAGPVGAEGGTTPPGARPLPRPGTVTRAEAVRADGLTCPTELSLGQAGQGDELLYTAIVRDIRERVEAEKRINAFAQGLEASNRRLEEVNAQLEEASRLKSEFLANTSHELRTPLNGMMGFLQLVLDGMCESPEEEREFLQQSLQCSRHLLGLINDVLDIAKIESGKLSLEIERVDIESLFQEVRTVTHVQAAQKGVHLVFETPADRTHSVRCDFAKTKQVLINLVGNSIKFTPKGSIQVRAVPQPRLGHVTFEVVDTGIGIPREQLKVVFEKFAQGDGSTTRKYGGTGLGLAISRSLIEIMGGVIGVESEGTGKGTRMYFSLPLWNAAAGETEAVTEAPPETISGPAEGPLVLVVEDDAVFRLFLVALLHRHGFRTIEALHAEAAWGLARRLRPACVVADYALSCAEGAVLRTGWDLAERMTSEPVTRRIPVIFVTGFDHVVHERLVASGFARKPEHLMKPIDGKALVERITAMIGDIEGRQVRVLLADDDATVATYVRAVLPADRFHLELATNGEQCLHALRTQPRGFDLMLLDLMMPDVSGYDVLREMALTGTAAGLPVLVLTNFPEARNAEEKRLLDEGIVLDVVAKTAVHDNPLLLPHLIEWHLQLEHGDASREAA